MKILLIEDDREAASYLIQALDECGHVTHHASDGETGFAMASGMEYDVLIVDRMLPRRDGLSIIESLRAEEDKTPVLILSALGEVDDRVTGLRAGGDDYLVKPYAFAELIARVEAFMAEHVVPAVPLYEAQQAQGERWKVLPVIEALKAKAEAAWRGRA